MKVRPGRLRAPLIWGVVAVVLALVATGLVVRARTGVDEPAGRRRAPATATVTRGDLVEVTTAGGRLAYGPERLAESRLAGTVTALGPLGSIVDRGRPLFRIDDTPVVLIYGTLPSYRELTAGRAATSTQAGGAQGNGGQGNGGQGNGGQPGGGATAGAEGGAATGAAVPATKGADVKQFEENLKALGYTGFTVDDQYSDQTATAVKRWQKDLGLPQTGSVELGRVHVAPGPVRVASHKTVTGAAANGPVLAYTATGRLVTASLRAHEQAVATPATKVSVLLPSGKEVAGTVVSVNSPSGEQAAGGQEPMVEVVVSLNDASSVQNVDDGPTRVRFVVRERKDVLIVPVGALLALAEGGYGLEALDAGSTRIVAVTTGLFANGNVEVSGADVREGMTVGMAQ